MATDPQTLLAEAKCFMCYGVSEEQAVELALLARILQAATAGGEVRITEASEVRITEAGDTRVTD